MIRKLKVLSISLVLFVGFMALSFGVVRYYFNPYKTVVFRISDKKQDLDYDYEQSIRFLEKHFKKKGYRVLGRTYQGNLYDDKFKDAYINVYVRGFEVFYDMRKNENAKNILFIPRFFSNFIQELSNFEIVISPQKSFLMATGRDVEQSYVPSGATTYNKIDPQYKFDVLYIYEYSSVPEVLFSNVKGEVKSLSSVQFYQLSQKDREDILKQAKLVVYHLQRDERDDETYVPFAVWDIISYGRPLLTNINVVADEQSKKNDVLRYVAVFRDMEDILLKTNMELKKGEKKLEKRAQNAYKALLKFKNEEEISFFNKL